ncbi:hypothetical protein V12G01_11628 [Vibrio alginolyticus 12G01]|uniref:Uncharacterized protein n=1 Tax=Vibrio parahaemolyticus TaxID=670 RepID=A0A7M1VVI9_VIBPH|nr:hypothetical protein V12G01_11628 [Vibrio alginolyticus 12G01]QOS19057.1 hypothetical protein VP323_00022 [Vibrio parahaemolyticus]
MLTYFSLILFVLQVLLLLSRIRISKNIKCFFSVLISSVFFIVFYHFKLNSYANDYLSYFHWFLSVAELDSIQSILSYRSDSFLSFYFYLSSYILGVSKLSFDISIWVLFFIAILIISRVILNYEEVATFLCLIVFSRLFFEYTGNTLRSFLSAIFIIPFVYFGLEIYKRLSFIIYYFVSFLTHFKLNFFITIFRLISGFVSLFQRHNIKSNNFLSLFFLLSVILFVLKFFLGFKFESLIGFLIDLVSSYDGDVKLRTERLDSAFELSLPLFIQILTYVFYPIGVCVFFQSDKNYELLFFLILSLLTIAVFFPEYFLIERLCQVVFIVGMLEISKKGISNIFYIPIIIVNFYSIYTIQFG